MAGAKQIMVIDPQMAGIAGDMMVGALLDLGSNGEKVMEAMRSTKDYLGGCKKLEIMVDWVTRGGFHACKLDIKIEEEFSRRTGTELREAIKSCVEDLELSDGAKQFALSSVSTLVEAEAKIQGGRGEEAHLYELGSVDTVADIIGTAVALENLNLFEDTTTYSMPVAVGGGLLNFSHGIVSIPAPVTLEILRSKGVPMTGGPVDAELATPTGVSLLVNLSHGFTYFYPPMKPTRVGYGAGTKNIPQIPNLLRIVLGEEISPGLLSEEICVLETNLDDTTGEIIGYTLDKMLEEGARDVSIIPTFTKKNRPGQILKVIADRDKAEYLSRILMEETGTLGVRVYPCQRHTLARESVLIEVVINGMKEYINVKVARDEKGQVLQIKPEYDEAKRLAKRVSQPLRAITDLIQRRAIEVLSKK